MLDDFEAGAISLGVVPQDNNLWPLLSCKQHLQLFAELRGVPHKKVQGILDSALKHMELQEKLEQDLARFTWYSNPEGGHWCAWGRNCEVDWE